MSDNIVMNQPNLFIVGAAKSGTTSLHQYLSQHPEIYMSPIKEPHFFGRDIRWGNFEKGYQNNTYLNVDKYLETRPLKPKHLAYISNERDYRSLFFDATGQKILGDASTSYLYSEYAAQEIYDFNPKAKIIIILRDPIDRALSHYFMDLSGRNQRERDILKGLRADFEAEKKGWGISHLYIELGLYYEQVLRYLNIFPKEQVLILRFEDLKQNLEKLGERISLFLGLGSRLNLNVNEVHNRTLIPKNDLIKSVIKSAKGLKDILPNGTKVWLKKKGSFLFETPQGIEVNSEARQYLESLLSDDWAKAQKLISIY